MLYIDQENGAENLVAQLGAIKAGVQVVTFAEKENEDALDHALRTTKAKGLLISPNSSVGENKTRLSFLQSLMPELATMYAGDDLKLAKYPALQHIVQTGFSNIRGVNMFKDLAVYTSPSLSTYQIPQNNEDDVTHRVFRDGHEVATHTSGDIVSAADRLWRDFLHHSDGEDRIQNPIFMSVELESPLGFASYLSCSTNFKKMFVPGSYNMSKMLKSIPRQHSSIVVCDSDFYSLEVPPAAAAEYQEMCQGVSHALVAGKAGQTELFKNAQAKSVDPFTLQ